MNKVQLIKTKKILEKYQLLNVFPDEILRESIYLFFSNKENIVFTHDKFDSLYLVLNGKVFVTSYSQNGDKIIVDSLITGELFGDIEYYSNIKVSMYNLTATLNTEVLKIPMKLVNDILNNHVPYLQFMCHQLTNKLINSSKNYSKTLLQPAKNKLASYIVKQYELLQDFEVNFPSKVTSEVLGISDRHLRRLLLDFEQSGLIKKGNSKITILNLKNLIELSNY